jgi:hypothetical protein
MFHVPFPIKGERNSLKSTEEKQQNFLLSLFCDALIFRTLKRKAKRKPT